MKPLLTTLVALSLCSLASADAILLTWPDLSENEDGFEMRGRLETGEWEVIGKTPRNTNQLEVDSAAHVAWQVFAFNVFGYSLEGSNVLERDLPNAPGTLQVAKSTVTEKITRTTVTEYKIDK